jgi:hypothetical protein
VKTTDLVGTCCPRRSCSCEGVEKKRRRGDEVEEWSRWIGRRDASGRAERLTSLSVKFPAVILVACLIVSVRPPRA